MQQWVDSCDRLFFIEFDRHQRKSKKGIKNATRMILQLVWSNKVPTNATTPTDPSICPASWGKKTRYDKDWKGMARHMREEHFGTLSDGFRAQGFLAAVPSCSIDFSPTTHFEISSMKDSASDLFILFHLDKDPDWMSKHAKNCKSDPGQRCQYYVYIILYYIYYIIL